MQKLQYDAMIAVFQGRAETEEQLIPVEQQVYVPTVKSLAEDAPDTDEGRDERVQQLTEFVALLGLELALPAMFGDQQAKSTMASLGTIVVALEVAKAVASATVVSVSVGD